MKNYVTSALHALETRRGDRGWSRLDRQPVGLPETHGHGENTSEMRHFLAVQTSQIV